MLYSKFPHFWSPTFPFGHFYCLCLFTIIYFFSLRFVIFSLSRCLTSAAAAKSDRDDKTLISKGLKITVTQRDGAKTRPMQAGRKGTQFLPDARPRDRRDMWKPSRSLILRGDWWLLLHTGDVFPGASQLSARKIMGNHGKYTWFRDETFMQAGEGGSCKWWFKKVQRVCQRGLLLVTAFVNTVVKP